jgi:hypothetical protein
VLVVYESIIQHKTIVGRLQIGHPCGDTLNAVLKGTDGRALKSKKAVGYLQTLSKMAEIVNDSTTNAGAFDEKGLRQTQDVPVLQQGRRRPELPKITQVLFTL